MSLEILPRILVPRQPIRFVSFDDAKAYVLRLSEEFQRSRILKH